MEPIDSAPSVCAPQKSTAESERLFPTGHRTRVAVLVCGLVFVAAVFWKAAQVLFLFFLACLFALALRGVSDWIGKWSHLPRKWSLFATVLCILVAASAIGWLLAPEIQEEIEKLREELPRSVEALKQRLNETKLGQQVVRAVEQQSAGAAVNRQLSKAAAIVSGGLSAIAGIALVAVLSIYLAADPMRYVNGFALLFPRQKRARVGEVMHSLGVALRRGFLGQMALIGVNGVITTTALWLLGIPLALTLGLMSAILNFIPNFGPIIAAIPAMLIAYLEGPEKALYVGLVYLGYQSLDGYVLTPLVQKKAVSIPPAIVLLAQVLFGMLFGALGVLVAVYLTATALVLVKALYIEDVLGEKTTFPGENEDQESRKAVA